MTSVARFCGTLVLNMLLGLVACTGPSETVQEPFEWLSPPALAFTTHDWQFRIVDASAADTIGLGFIDLVRSVDALGSRIRECTLITDSGDEEILVVLDQILPVGITGDVVAAGTRFVPVASPSPIPGDGQIQVDPPDRILVIYRQPLANSPPETLVLSDSIRIGR